MGQISYGEWIFTRYIDELEKQKAIAEEHRERLVRDTLCTEVAKEEKKAEALIEELDDDFYKEDGLTGIDNAYYKDAVILDFQEFLAEKILEYYNELSEKFQKGYAIFENQVAHYMKETNRPRGYKVFDFSIYPKIDEVNNAVNVMKHGEGRSLEALKAINSKFLALPKEVLSLMPDMNETFMTSMYETVQGMTAGLILNLEPNDLIEFYDEAINAWKDKLNEYIEAHKTPNGTTSL